jgi:hypothetical protein
MKFQIQNFRVMVMWVALWAIPFLLAAQSVDKNYLLGKFDPAAHPQFVKLSDEHTQGSARGAYLRKETYDAFIRMSDAASKDEGVRA